MLLIESYMQGSRHFSMSMSSFVLFVDQLIWLIFIYTFKPCLVLLIFLLADEQLICKLKLDLLSIIIACTIYNFHHWKY